MKRNGQLLNRVAKVVCPYQQEISYRGKCRVPAVAVVGLGHHVKLHNASLFTDNVAPQPLRAKGNQHVTQTSSRSWLQLAGSPSYSIHPKLWAPMPMSDRHYPNRVSSYDVGDVVWERAEVYAPIALLT